MYTGRTACMIASQKCAIHLRTVFLLIDAASPISLKRPPYAMAKRQTASLKRALGGSV